MDAPGRRNRRGGPLIAVLIGIDLVLLTGLALAVAALRGRESVGLAAGTATVAVGVAALLTRPGGAEPGWLVLDGASIARVLVTGLTLVATFAVLPRRHTAPRVTAASIGLAAASIALAVAPEGLARAGIWAVHCALPPVVLPAGRARRMAIPYLAVAAVSGALGDAVGGRWGAGLSLLAVAIASGVPPFHSWIVGAHTMAPTALAVAVSAPMPAVALIARDPIPMGPVAVGALIVAALLAAGLVGVQRELARAVGLLTVSLQALVVLALADADAVGHLGGILLWCATGLALLGLGLVAAALRSRLGRVPVERNAGLAGETPIFAALFLLFGLAAVGTPGTAGFASADLVLHGTLAHRPALLLGFAAAVSMQAYAVLHLFFRVFFGPPAAGPPVTDASPRERWALLLLAGVLVFGGLAPQWMVLLTSS